MRAGRPQCGLWNRLEPVNWLQPLSRGPWETLTWADIHRGQSLVQVQVSRGDIPAHCWNSNTSLDTLKWALFPFSACEKEQGENGTPRHMQQQPSHPSGLMSRWCGLGFQTPDIWSNRGCVTSGRTRACRAYRKRIGQKC